MSALCWTSGRHRSVLCGFPARGLGWAVFFFVGLWLGGCETGDDDDDSFATPDPALENQASYPGDFYQEILQSELFDKLEIEVDVMEGALPTTEAEDAFQEALDTLGETIDMLCNKPGGVDFLPITTISAPADKTEFSLEDVNDLELAHRDTYWHEGTMVLYFLYLAGHSDYDDPEAGTAVVGYAYHGSSMAIFMETVNTKPALLRPSLLKTVTVHEFGHQIGLVDNGADMQVVHDDPEHPPHCENSACMMYWLNNASSGLMDIISGEIPDFDDNCLLDIYSAGGKDARGLSQPN